MSESLDERQSPLQLQSNTLISIAVERIRKQAETSTSPQLCSQGGNTIFEEAMPIQNNLIVGTTDPQERSDSH